MQRRRLGGLLALSVALAGCSVGIAELNGRPTKYYQQSVSFVARVSRVQPLPGETFLELADAQEHRIYARAEGGVDVQPDEWVKVSGTLVPEARVGGKIVYDVVLTESVRPARAPWLRDLF